MAETINESIKRENTRFLQSRVFAAIIGLGGQAALAGFTEEQLNSLKNAGSTSSGETLRRSLVLDLGFAQRRGIKIGKDLTNAANIVLIQNMKGGE